MCTDGMRSQSSVFYLPRLFRPAAAGTKPGANGQTLVSTGLADLDRILGGGLALGSLLLVEEDGASQHHETLARYFLAEGVACDQVRWRAVCAGW